MYFWIGKKYLGISYKKEILLHFKPLWQEKGHLNEKMTCLNAKIGHFGYRKNREFYADSKVA
jgi:hypothetical protein